MTSKKDLSVNSAAVYRDGLDGDVRKRYDEKTRVIKCDPYELSENEFSCEVKDWPDVAYFDVMNYLILQTSSYTKDQLKNYKSLEAYKLFQDGWIKQVLHKQVEGMHLIRAKVLHSMKINEKPLTPWVILSSDGSIDAAHCTCKAGLGECCSHVGAVLFAMETGTRIRKDSTVTDVPAYWMFPSRNSSDKPFKRVRDMNLQSANKKRKGDSECKPTTPQMSSTNDIPSPTKAEEEDFMSGLSDVMPDACCLYFSDKHSGRFIPKSLSPEWPINLSTIFRKDLLNSSYDSVIDISKSVDINFTCAQAAFTQKQTIGQSTNVFWGKYRTGRITSSTLYSVCKTKVAAPSMSLVKQICSTETKKTGFVCAPLEWGKKKECEARQAYKDIMVKEHDQFKVQDAGLILNVDYPQFGASPDGLVSCLCCGEGCLEIKCPYSLRDSETIDMPWLLNENGVIKLDQTHNYFYQIQMHLFITGRDYCDFFVWCPGNNYCERIFKNKVFWENSSQLALSFHEKVVMPELLSKYFTRKETPAPFKITQTLNKSTSNKSKTDQDEKFCICRQGEEGKMILCENENCSIVWYHMSCLKMKRAPKGKWFCQKCKPPKKK